MDCFYTAVSSSPYPSSNVDTGFNVSVFHSFIHCLAGVSYYTGNPFLWSSVLNTWWSLQSISNLDTPQLKALKTCLPLPRMEQISSICRVPYSGVSLQLIALWVSSRLPWKTVFQRWVIFIWLLDENYNSQLFFLPINLHFFQMGYGFA